MIERQDLSVDRLGSTPFFDHTYLSFCYVGSIQNSTPFQHRTKMRAQHLSSVIQALTVSLSLVVPPTGLSG